MWVLFGTRNDTAEQEEYYYFIGVFDDEQKAIKKRDELITINDTRLSDYYVKKVEVNAAYTYNFSWED
jgi:hypothetical protein